MYEMQRLIVDSTDGGSHGAAEETQQNLADAEGRRLGDLSAISRKLRPGVNESSFIDPDAQHYSP